MCLFSYPSRTRSTGAPGNMRGFSSQKEQNGPAPLHICALNTLFVPAFIWAICCFRWCLTCILRTHTHNYRYFSRGRLIAYKDPAGRRQPNDHASTPNTLAHAYAAMVIIQVCKINIRRVNRSPYEEPQATPARLHHRTHS